MNIELKEITLHSETLFQGKVLHLVKDRVRLPDGRESVREVIHHAGAVGIVAHPTADTLVMVRQYRYALGREMWEIPAGKLEPGEDPLVTAQRELKEETGYTANHWEPLASYHSCVGYSDELIHLFRARNLTPGEASPDEGEFLTRHEMPLSRLWRMFKDGEITDGKTVIALLSWKAETGHVPHTAAESRS